MVETILCELCGAVAKHPVMKTIAGRELAFCCSGCLQVYELMQEEGLAGVEKPAQLPTKPTTALGQKPAGAIPLRTITLPIVGMSCANCVAHVDHSLRVVPGVVNVNVSLADERAIVEITTDAVTIADLKKAVKAAGYEALDPATGVELN